MKKIISITSLLSLLLLFNTFLQAQQELPAAINVCPQQLEISDNQTVVLIFPTAIKNFDRGTKDVLAEKVKGVENALKVKADNDSIQNSNLHVFTADGIVYSFYIKYCPFPQRLTILFDPSFNRSGLVEFTNSPLNDAEISNYAKEVADLRAIRNSPKSSWKGKARLNISGTYLYEGMLFFQLTVSNRSIIPFNIDFIKVYVRDNKKSKRSSVTEKEITPISNYYTSDTINAYSKGNLVFCLKQFTISENKHLSVEIFEKNGDRHLVCKLKGKDILKAKSFKPPLITSKSKK